MTEPEYLEKVHMTPFEQARIVALLAQELTTPEFRSKHNIDLSILDTPFEGPVSLLPKKPARYLVTATYKGALQGMELELTGDQKHYTDNRQVFIPKSEVEKNVGKNFVAIEEKKAQPLTADSFLGQA